jgi:hypothetical protein
VIGATCVAIAPTFAWSAIPSTENWAIRDRPRDIGQPAHNQQLVIRSHGSEMNAMLYVAAGSHPKPTVVPITRSSGQ